MCSDLDLADDVLQLFGARAQLIDLAVGQLVQDLAAHALVVDQRERRQADVGHAVFAVHHRRDGQRGPGGTLHALAQMADRHGDGVERRALVLDDLRAGGLDELLDLLVVLVPLDAVMVGRMRLVGVDVVVGDVDEAPGHEGGVAVLRRRARGHSSG